MVVFQTNAMHIEGNHSQQMRRFAVVRSDDVDATLEGLESKPRDPRDPESIKRQIKARAALKYLHPGHLMIPKEWESTVYDRRQRQLGNTAPKRLNRVLSRDSMYLVTQSSVESAVLEEFLKSVYGRETEVLFENQERERRRKQRLLVA
jgi:hypothetical protein